MKKNSKDNSIFTNKQLEELCAFGVILKKIHDRLIAEGFSLKNGEIVQPADKFDKI